MIKNYVINILEFGFKFAIPIENIIYFLNVVSPKKVSF